MSQTLMTSQTLATTLKLSEAFVTDIHKLYAHDDNVDLETESEL